MDLSARAGKLVALLCVSCVFFEFARLDVELVLAPASAAVSACALLACGARRLLHVVSEFS
jgi:hypothetical protein